MKKAILLSLILVTLFTNNVNAQQSDALEYMQELFEIANDFKTETWQYLKAVTRGKGPKAVEKKRQKLISEMKNAKYSIKGKRAYNSDEGLKNALIEYLDLSYKVLKEDYDKILDMEAIAQESYDLMEAYLLAQEKANEKLNSSFDGVIKAQNEFAANNNITLIESDESDETDLKIKKANDALKYYNTIYLIFFKSYKQEMYVLDAQSRSDVTAMEQHNSSFISFNNESKEALKNMESYSGDGALIAAAKKMLSFYTTEADKDFPSLIDFYINKDNFEKIQKSFEAKKKKTQDDVDKYNNALTKYNNSIGSFNKTIETMNNNRSNNLNEWNKNVSIFFDKHSK